jgi:cell division protein FtsN
MFGWLLAYVVMLVVGFGSGFGFGWYFSQQSTKKGFRAALEQQSLESQPADSQQKPASKESQEAVAAPNQASPSEPLPLSFFENLPKGSKETRPVLGSGINEQPVPAKNTAASQPTTEEKPVATDPVQPKQPQDNKPQTATYLVQVASLSSLKDAEATKARLATKGYSATIAEVDLGEKGYWYRIRVGRHLDINAATDIASKIGDGATVVPDRH